MHRGLKHIHLRSPEAPASLSTSAMFVARVAAGRAFRTTEGELELAGDAPPLGYDSVVGEVGEALNYDELVVYNESAAMPEYLIMYTIT